MTCHYDANDRVTDVTSPALESYTYNPTGDRLGKTAPSLATGAYLYTAGTHQLSSIGNAPRASDANGNTTGSVIGGSDMWPPSQNYPKDSWPAACLAAGPLCAIPSAGIIALNQSDPSTANPLIGKTGSEVTCPNKNGNKKQTRRYGDDGYPETDTDWDHSHAGLGTPHVYDW